MSLCRTQLPSPASLALRCCGCPALCSSSEARPSLLLKALLVQCQTKSRPLDSHQAGRPPVDPQDLALSRTDIQITPASDRSIDCTVQWFAAPSLSLLCGNKMWLVLNTDKCVAFRVSLCSGRPASLQVDQLHPLTVGMGPPRLILGKREKGICMGNARGMGTVWVISMLSSDPSLLRQAMPSELSLN